MAADPKKPPLVFGQPEKTDYKRALVLLAIIIAGIFMVALMASMAPPQKPLNCRTDIRASLINFGTCTTDD